MDTVQSWQLAILQSLHDLWSEVIGFLPNLFGAIVVFFVGTMISVSLGILVTRVLRKIRVDKASEEIGLNHLIEESGFRANLSLFVGETVKWFLVIVFLMAAVDILGLPRVSEFLSDILLYIPNIIAAVLILAVAIIVANFIAKLISKSSVRKVLPTKSLASVAKWAILVFGIMAALVQLGVAKTLIETLFAGMVAMVSLAGGLAFGLGGKEKAAELLSKINYSKKGRNGNGRK